MNRHQCDKQFMDELKEVKYSPQTLLMAITGCWTREGGIEQVNRSLVRLFARSRQFNKVVILSLTDTQGDVDLALSDLQTSTLLRAFGYSANKIKFTLAFLKNLVVCHPDFIYFDHIHLIPLGLVGRLLGCQYAFMAYGIEVWKRPTLLRRIAVSWASLGLTISEHTKGTASKVDSVFRKLQVCPLGLHVDPTVVKSKEYNRIRERFAGRNTVLIVARMSASEGYKGHLELIEAVNHLCTKHPDVLLIIVGRGSGVPFLQDVVAARHLQQFVTFTGFMPDELLSSYYELCDVFAMPSRKEGFGLVYLEAMAHGKPCIGSRVDAAGEVIVDGKTGFLVDPDDVGDFADRLDLLLSNGALRERMGNAGRLRYENLFTEEKFHNRFSKIFFSVM